MTPKRKILPSQSNRQLSNEMATEIVVSLVGGGFAVVVALISKIGHDNKKDHGIVHQSLGRIEQKIDGHVENHK
jgi:hypothetical protein